MKRKTQLLALSVLLVGVQGVVSATAMDVPYPSDAEASYNLSARDTYADQHAGKDTNADQHVSKLPKLWGVNFRRKPQPHDPFPFGGGPVDD
jgi:hypothetical protein